VEETLDETASISVVARRNGLAPNLLYRWRRLMLEAGAVAVSGDDDVTFNRAVRQLGRRRDRAVDHIAREVIAFEDDRRGAGLGAVADPEHGGSAGEQRAGARGGSAFGDALFDVARPPRFPRAAARV